MSLCCKVLATVLGTVLMLTVIAFGLFAVPLILSSSEGRSEQLSIEANRNSAQHVTKLRTTVDNRLGAVFSQTNATLNEITDLVNDFTKNAYGRFLKTKEDISALDEGLARPRTWDFLNAFLLSTSFSFLENYSQLECSSTLCSALALVTSLVGATGVAVAIASCNCVLSTILSWIFDRLGRKNIGECAPPSNRKLQQWEVRKQVFVSAASVMYLACVFVGVFFLIKADQPNWTYRGAGQYVFCATTSMGQWIQSPDYYRNFSASYWYVISAICMEFVLLSAFSLVISSVAKFVAVVYSSRFSDISDDEIRAILAREEQRRKFNERPSYYS